jgi:solute carrier family 25 carnitine/acylcarnitine transporter 20/29
MMISFFGGGLAGSGSWLFTYPIDYIKTVIQSENLEARKFKSSMDCVRKKYAEEGIRTFFKGLGVTMIRSFPVNGCGFMAFEFMMRILGRRGT